MSLRECYGELIANPRRAIPRLTELRRVLAEELPEKLNGHKFHMGVFAAPATKGAGAADIYSEQEGLGFEVKPTRLSCDTVACAAGWGALLSPKLRRGGPRFVQDFRGGPWRFDPYAGGGLSYFYGLTYGGGDFLFFGGGLEGSEVGEEARLEVIGLIDLMLAEARGEAAP